MVSFEDLKVLLSTYITKRGRVDYQELLKWSATNKVGNTVLYLLIRELAREKRVRTSGEYVLGTLRVGNNDVKLAIPTSVEALAGTPRSVTGRRQVRQRPVRSTSILEALSERERAEERQSTEITGKAEEGQVRGRVEAETEAAKAEVKPGQEVGTKENKEVPSEAPEVAEVGSEAKAMAETKEVEDYSTLATSDFITVLRNIINEEVPQDREEALKVAVAMLNYLSKYWSVGELRLRIDIAKQFGGVNERIMRIEDGVLRALRRMGVIEVVEPGVVNRVRELPKDLVKLRLDSLFT